MKMDRQKWNGRLDSVSRVIKVTPSALYQAYLNPNALVVWMPPTGMSSTLETFNPIVGGGYKMILTYEGPDITSGKTTANTDVVEATFVKLVEDKKIALSGEFESDDPSFFGKMIMSWYFEEVDEGTKVTIIVENVPDGINKSDHLAGLNSTLDNLEKYVGKQ